MSAKMGLESGYLEFGSNELKRFFQWILGCTYAKKTMTTRIAEMFHFAEAPHIIVYEKTETNPWWWTVGVILVVLVAVLSLWYTFEAAGRSVTKFFRAALREPQSTVSTPRCLSPVKDANSVNSSKKCSPQLAQASQSTTSATEVRQKIRMNEPVNCVFVRPMPPKSADSPKLPVPMQSSDEEEIPEVPSPKKEEKKKNMPPPRLEDLVFSSPSNVNCRPTMVGSPFTTQRKSSGKDKDEHSVATTTSENGPMGEWIAEQITGCQRLDDERSTAGADATAAFEPLRIEEEDEEEEDDRVVPQAVSNGFMNQIQELIAFHLNQDPDELNVIRSDDSSNENVSEMSPVTESTAPILTEIPFSVNLESKSEGFSVGEPVPSSSPKVGQETIGSEEEADIIIDDSHLLAETENECEGSILVSGSKQKVLFRWTDSHPDTVDNVTITGSFFGWKMNVPMRRNGENVFELCVQLPAGMHDYLIHVFRFD